MRTGLVLLNSSQLRFITGILCLLIAGVRILYVLQKAKEKAGIKQSGSMHMLRHSFATHLLDKGIDVVFIQKLPGHNDIKTTLKYLHVTNKDLIHILSPLEDIENLFKNRSWLYERYIFIILTSPNRLKTLRINSDIFEENVYKRWKHSYIFELGVMAV